MITRLCLRKVVVVVHLFKALPAAWTFTAYAVRAKHCGSMSRAVDLHCILLLTIPFLPQIYLYSSEFMNLVLGLKLPGCER